MAQEAVTVDHTVLLVLVQNPLSLSSDFTFSLGRFLSENMCYFKTGISSSFGKPSSIAAGDTGMAQYFFALTAGETV